MPPTEGRAGTPHQSHTGVHVEAEFAVINEFTAVRVRKLRTRNGQRLEIQSLRLEHSIRLDALALEALSWQDPEVISGYLEQPFGPEHVGGSE